MKRLVLAVVIAVVLAPAAQATRIKDISAIKGVRSVRATGERRYRVEADRDVRGEVVLRVAQKGGPLMGLTVHEPSLDEIYNRYFEEHRDAA